MVNRRWRIGSKKEYTPKENNVVKISQKGFQTLKFARLLLHTIHNIGFKCPQQGAHSPFKHQIIILKNQKRCDQHMNIPQSTSARLLQTNIEQIYK